MFVEAYLFFQGRCEEALHFYRGAIGAEITALMRFSDAPPGEYKPAPETLDKIMHANLKIGSTTVMASDGECTGAPGFKGFSLHLAAETKDEAQRLFDALADGGQVQMPLGETFWSPAFGMLTDRFGVSWMVGVNH